jgi:hypothetical protein
MRKKSTLRLRLKKASQEVAFTAVGFLFLTVASLFIIPGLLYCLVELGSLLSALLNQL